MQSCNWWCSREVGDDSDLPEEAYIEGMNETVKTEHSRYQKSEIKENPGNGDVIAKLILQVDDYIRASQC